MNFFASHWNGESRESINGLRDRMVTLNRSLTFPENFVSPTKKPLFILRTPDEMRHPYESLLKPLCSRIVWFNKIEEMVAAALDGLPCAVLADLDTLPRPVDSYLEQIRTAFPDTDIIGVSSDDSAKLALQCIHCGFSDFLVKPVSPEEVAWAIRKAHQRQEILAHMQDPRTAMVRAAQQISSSGTPALVRVSALNFLQRLTGATGAAWIKRDAKSWGDIQILASLPNGVTTAKVSTQLPLHDKPANFRVVKAEKSKERRILLKLQGDASQSILLWGIQNPITSHIRTEGQFLLEHAEIALMNLQRFEELKAQTFIDDLTGLYNSRYLKFALSNAVLKCKKPEQGFTVLFIDVDHFKKINDTHGHLIGSEFLVTIGKTIRNAIRQIDPVFRYGGDEFVVILNDTLTEGAKIIAERIRKNIERRVFVIQGKRIQTTVSIGLASYPEHAAEQDSLLKLADEAMYSAKKTSRNSVHLAVESPDARTKDSNAG